MNYEFEDGIRLVGIEGAVPVSSIKVAYRCFDLNGKSYLLVIFKNDSPIAIPDSEVNANALAAAGLSVCEVGDELGREEPAQSDASNRPVAYIFTSGRSGSETIAVISHGSVQFLQNSEDARLELVKRGVVISVCRVDDLSWEVVLDEHPESRVSRSSESVSWGGRDRS